MTYRHLSERQIIDHIQMIRICCLLIVFLLQSMESQSHNQMMRIFIIGTTAVGKTKLSVELAKHLGGEIISCDSKQLYQHASIMTAKVTEEQAQNVPHHMVDCLALHENLFNRNKYYKEASKAIQTIESKKKIPIIVGGTNYYIETLLYNLKSLDRRLSSSGEESQEEDSNQNFVFTVDKKLTEKQEKELQWMRKLSKDEKYQLLLKYDSQIALKTHRNDEKRLTQFLERVIINGEMVSDNYEGKTSSLRTNNTIVFWIRNSDREELLGMVTKRIYKMLDKAGLSQIFAIFYYIQLINKQKNKETEVNIIQQYSGACSSIGVREFKDLYLQVLPALEEIFQEHLQKLITSSKLNYNFIYDMIFSQFERLTYSEQTLSKCRDQLILDTKHYCKRQLSWIRNRMYLNTDQNREHFFVLELSQQKEDQKREVLDRFQRQIAKRAIEIVDLIRKEGFGAVKEREEEFSGVDKQEPLEQWKKYFCEACNLELNGLYTWNCHITSKRHIKQVRYMEKKEGIEKHIAQQKQLAKQRKQNAEKEQLKEIQKNQEKE